MAVFEFIFTLRAIAEMTEQQFTKEGHVTFHQSGVTLDIRMIFFEFINLFTALLENGASEQGARMSAMDNATRNAGEMITKYTTIYNRSRQAAITKELIEIIAGAEAL